ncbi:N-acetylneuraminate synthase [Paenibacillus sp. JMULE4]|uniref:N-acetylneuraminate synthase n=1 Tax=Paenibacillus sp. JMULE4 TaxID=2518342 RepID=UPI0015770B08|nr:N-acetylneuraminate synthase [Paenibacillus sp. JMULE4]NTZ16379.1 N-acetylneuraminate synthase [Paenibacillus sp. JMULE4]
MNNKRTYIIAEAGVNHNGSLELAKQLIDVAADAGADAVKFQTFKTEKVISRYARKADYQKQTTGEEETQFEMVKKLELSEEDHFELLAHSLERNIQLLSTPFDTDSLNFLVNELSLASIKVPSGEITNAQLLLEVSRTGKPIILSTGMSTLGEIEDALAVLSFGYTMPKSKIPSMNAFKEAYCSDEGQKALKSNVTILHCTTEYPAPLEDVNLRIMDTLKSAFDLPVGFSDHTQGIAVAIAAAARGACLIEKHFTLDRSLPGPDHQASLEPKQLKEMIDSIRMVDIALGNGIKIPAKSELKNKEIARKSLVAACEIKEGTTFSHDNIAIKRPGTGISPMAYWDYLGKKATRSYREDEVIEN